MANFMSDQLEGELKRNQSVQDGKISQAEADEQAQEWEKVRRFIGRSFVRRLSFSFGAQ